MFVTPTVRLPGHGDASGGGRDGGRRDRSSSMSSSSDSSSYGAHKRASGCETYLAAGSCHCDDQSYTGHLGTETTRSRSWSGVLPFSSDKFQPWEIYYLHPHWRAVMGEEAWYQSISDFEEGNYFNSPHLQHGRHGNAAAMEDEESMNGVINMSAYMSNAKHIPESYHIHEDPYFSTDPMMQSSHDQISTAWPLFSPDGAHGMEQEMFANIDINRDLEHLVKGPMGDLDGLPSSSQALEMLQPPAPIMTHGHAFASPAGSPETTSTTSQDGDMGSAYSPSMGHSNDVYAPFTGVGGGLGMAEATTPPVLVRPQLRGPSWSSSLSPLRRERSHHHQSLKRVRKSLPSSPMRHDANASRSASSFGESASPSSMASPIRCRSPDAREQQRAMGGGCSPCSSTSPAYAAGERAGKDEFLVKSRRAGMTYRDIKQQGGFAEAESTLRGRYRMLTKSREERVRNPKWTPVDVVLLRKAVLRFCNGKDPVLVKVPWKEVARFIFDNGGTYLFGNATCRKKWDELASFGMDQEVDEDEEMCDDGTQDCEGEEELGEEEDEEDEEEDDREEAVQ